MKKLVVTLLSLSVVAIGVQAVTAAAPVFLRDFKLHDFDTSIYASLGYDSTASVSYLRELATNTPDQQKTRQTYEKIGCHPFYVIRNGKIEESGFNCRSFFCAGYTKGPKICKDTDDKAYGGVVEISRRLGLVTIFDQQKRFADYPDSDQTSSMKSRIDKLAPYRCRPLFLLDFDVVVGEGYECDEVGKYPTYSAKNLCMEDFRKQDGLVCQVPIRANEFDLRLKAIAKFHGGSASSGASSAASGTGSSVSSVSSSESSSQDSGESSSAGRTFPDVIQGKYGYTAIMDLTARGIIRGYPDGTFRPKNAVNRAEFTKVLLETLHPEQIRGETFCFRDIRDEWYSVVACAAKRLGWVIGYGDGTFRPGQTMRKAEAIKVIIHALGAPRDSNAVLPDGVSEGQWYTPYVRKAVELEIILESSFEPNGQMTRADAAVWIYRGLKAQTSGLVTSVEAN